ncbi:MAG TPA: hypothetical protein VMW27_29940 [Thermoanaerobaculia bacterium]|nr:hypothetical protein [Thermoanaerobaculia bacterium]
MRGRLSALALVLLGFALASSADETGEYLRRVREEGRALAARPSWTAADVQKLLTHQLVDPERFVADAAFRSRILSLLPDALDPAVPPALRDDLLDELNQVRGIDFQASESIESAWGAVPRRSAERRQETPRTLRFADDVESPLTASVYSLPSFFFDAAAAEPFLAAVRAADPKRTLIVLTDRPLLDRLEERARSRLEERVRALGLQLLDTHGRAYSPWPRDPFSLVRGPEGNVLVLSRPNAQPGREEDLHLGAEVVQNLPDEIDRAWGGVRWAEAPVPFHNGQVLLTRKAAWITLHALEPAILQRLGLDRVPVESFSTQAGIDRYIRAAREASKKLENLYGRPIRFVHPLPGEATLMRRLGGSAGYDLDSILTLLPKTALVADISAGRALLARLEKTDWESLQHGYGLEPEGLAKHLEAAQRTPEAEALDGFLDLMAEHLKKEGMTVRRLPLLTVPVSLLKNREGLTHREFLLTWNNVVVESPGGRPRAEGFASLLPTGDREAREVFTAAGSRLDLFPPLVRSIILNGGYRCASNHVRTAE